MCVASSEADTDESKLANAQINRYDDQMITQQSATQQSLLLLALVHAF